MARYVVLEFVDNREADLFVEGLDLDNADRRKRRLPFMTRVVAVFVKPGKTCTCWDGKWINYGDKNRQQSITRGEKFGWWVCTRCNRPRPAGHQLVNQLPLSDTYQGTVNNDYEFGVQGLQVSGIHTKNIDRPKKLRRKKEGK